MKCYFSFLQCNLEISLYKKNVEFIIFYKHRVIFRETKTQCLISQKSLHNFVGGNHKLPHCIVSTIKPSRKVVKSSFTSVWHNTGTCDLTKTLFFATYRKHTWNQSVLLGVEKLNIHCQSNFFRQINYLHICSFMTKPFSVSRNVCNKMVLSSNVECYRLSYEIG